MNTEIVSTVNEWLDFFVEQEISYDKACLEWKNTAGHERDQGSPLTEDDVYRHCGSFIIPVPDISKLSWLKPEKFDQSNLTYNPVEFQFRNDPQFEFKESEFPLLNGCEIIDNSIWVTNKATAAECLYAACIASRWPHLTISGGPEKRFSINELMECDLGFFMNLLMIGRRPSQGFRILDRWSILHLILPELTSGRDLAQNRYHAYDIYEHLLRSCDAVESANLRIRWAALLHDTGKVPTRKEKPNGEASFHNHEMHSARITVNVMKRFGLNREFGLPIKFLVRNHMFHYTDEWTDKAVRRFIRRVNRDQLKELIALRLADRKGSGKKTAFPKALQKLINHIDQIETEEKSFKISDMLVSGHDLMDLGMPAGPAMGDLLKEMHEAISSEQLTNDREKLLNYAQLRIREAQ